MRSARCACTFLLRFYFVVILLWFCSCFVAIRCVFVLFLYAFCVCMTASKCVHAESECEWRCTGKLVKNKKKNKYKSKKLFILILMMQTEQIFQFSVQFKYLLSPSITAFNHSIILMPLKCHSSSKSNTFCKSTKHCAKKNKNYYSRWLCSQSLRRIIVCCVIYFIFFLIKPSPTKQNQPHRISRKTNRMLPLSYDNDFPDSRNQIDGILPVASTPITKVYLKFVCIFNDLCIKF